MMKAKTKFLAGGILAALSVLWIILLKTVDVAPAGESRTEVGFSTLNQAFFDAFHGHDLLYQITELCGAAAILTAGLFACVGIYQLVKRRSLKAIDREIYALGGLYVVFVALYAFFEVVTVNCRPIIEEGATEAEASFPSTHTLLGCIILGSAFMVLSHFIKNKTLCTVLKTACAAAIAVTVLGRLFCGVHWLTDIIGGVMISAAVLFPFSGVLSMLRGTDKTAE